MLKPTNASMMQRPITIQSPEASSKASKSETMRGMRKYPSSMPVTTSKKIIREVLVPEASSFRSPETCVSSGGGDALTGKARLLMCSSFRTSVAPSMAKAMTSTVTRTACTPMVWRLEVISRFAPIRSPMTKTSAKTLSVISLSTKAKRPAQRRRREAIR